MNPGPKEASHEECRAALMAIPDLIFQIKDDGTFLNYKGAKEDLYVPPEQFIGKKVQEILPEQLARQTLEYMRLTLESQKLQMYEYSLQIGDHIKYFEARMVAYQKDKVIVVIRDITDRKLAEEKIKVFSDIADLAPASITIHDSKGKFLYVNQKTLDMHGYTREEFLALDLHQLDAPESAKLIQPRIEKLMTEGHTSFEVSHCRKDRSIFPLLVEVKMIQYAGGPAIMSVATDLTDRKLAEAELRNKIQELKFINDAAVGRELKLIELEKEVDQLRKELGRGPKYK